MHILPIILSVWSFKQETTERYLKSLQRLAFEEDAPDRIKLDESGNAMIVRGQTGLMAPDEVEAIRNRIRDRPTEPPKQGTGNEMIGSHFASTEITHSGTEAWDSLKARLAENDIVIDDDAVATLSAGFFAERKAQELLGHVNPERLRDELSADTIDFRGTKLWDARWVRDMESRPDREEIAEECFADLQKNFPKAIFGPDLEPAEKAIGFDPNIVEAERV